MSSGWSWFIIILSLANIAGCWWLAHANSRRSPDEPKETETMGHVWDGNLAELNQPLPRWWLYLFYISIVFGIGYVLVYPAMGNFKGLFGWTQVNQYEQELVQARERYSAIYDRLGKMTIEELATDEQAMGTGHRLYVNNCAVCHGSDGRGAQAFPNLTDSDWLYGGDPDSIVLTILNGRNSMMPALGATMSAESVDNIVNYVLSLSGQPHDAASAAAGANEFTICAACHGADGGGNTMLGAPNLTDQVWLYGNSAAEIRYGIMNGRNNRMPAHKEQLGEERARIVAAYVYSLSRSDSKGN